MSIEAEEEISIQHEAEAIQAFLGSRGWAWLRGIIVGELAMVMQNAMHPKDSDQLLRTSGTMYALDKVLKLPEQHLKQLLAQLKLQAGSSSDTE